MATPPPAKESTQEATVTGYQQTPTCLYAWFPPKCPMKKPARQPLKPASPPPPQPLHALSLTQLRIVELAARGKADKQLVEKLGMKFGTLREHWRRAFLKLGVRSRAEAVWEWGNADHPAPVGNPADSNNADTTARARRAKVKP